MSKLIVTFLGVWNQLFALQTTSKFLLVLPQILPRPRHLPSFSAIFTSLGSSSIHSCSDGWLEPVKAKRFFCCCIGKHYVRIVEHVQAIQSERVDLEVVQRELGVDVETDVWREGAGELLGQAGGRLAAHW